MAADDRLDIAGQRGGGAVVRGVAAAASRLAGLMQGAGKPQILFVCTENLCRSPMAEGLLRYHLAQTGSGNSFKVGSAGTLVSRPRARPDPRAIRAAAAAGVDLARIRASRVTERMLAESDFVFAMDRANLHELLKRSPNGHDNRISLLLSHIPEIEFEDVPDPYYGSVRGFYETFDLIEQAILSIIARGAIFK